MGEYKFLTKEQVDQFLKDGYLTMKHAFSKEKAAEWTKDLWVRLGMDPNDPKTWVEEKVHMPCHKQESITTFAPTVWGAICELLGGEERINPTSATWNDCFIVNFGTEDNCGPDKSIDPYKLDNWHVDGDFFVHYLDSPEQGLLVIPIFSEIQPRGGGTFISPDGIPLIAQYLADHPEGVLPTGLSFTPSTSAFADRHMERDPYYWSHLTEVKRCKQFVEITGDIGDVVLLHPLMLHSRAPNLTRALRVITNPPVSLKEPFNFARENKSEYSLVELKTLDALGIDRLDYKIITQRRMLVPRRVAQQQELLEKEKKRLAAQAQASGTSEASPRVPIAVV